MGCYKNKRHKKRKTMLRFARAMLAAKRAMGQADTMAPPPERPAPSEPSAAAGQVSGRPATPTVGGVAAPGCSWHQDTPVRPCTPPATRRAAAALSPACRAGRPDAADENEIRPVTSTPVCTPRRARDVYEFQGDQHPSPVRPLQRSAAPPAQEHPADGDTNGNSLGDLSGCRIVNIRALFDQILADSHDSPFDCSFRDCYFVKEVRKGFQSTFIFKCKMCLKTTVIDAHPNTESNVGLNRALVTGTLAAGGGYVNLEEMAAAIDMPCMAPTTYIINERIVGEVVEQAVLESMLAAGREEARLAREAGDIAPDNTPWIRVVADGMWSKRSYGNKYDAKSGVATIIGWRTKKVLFYGVRNKHCIVCTIANGAEPRPHACSKNYTGTSTRMECDIVLEGFKCSEEMHGLRYLQLVGDRDSSVYQAIEREAPYGPLERVKKIDCKNHLLRNYRSWILALAGDTKYPLPDDIDKSDRQAVKDMRKEMCVLRGTLKDNMLRLSTAIDKASTYRGETDAGNLHTRTLRLRQDIMNSPAHVFGEHGRCAVYFCEAARAREAAGTAAAGASARPPAPPSPNAPTCSRLDQAQPTPTLVARFRRTGLWNAVLKLVNTMADHADSLIYNVNNNVCEVANSVTAKFISGKRVFYSKRNSFLTRCGVAALAMNTSGTFRRVLHKKLQNGSSPVGVHTRKHSELKANRLRYKRLRRNILRNSRQPRRRVPAAGPDRHYGRAERAPNADVEDDVERGEDVAALPEDADFATKIAQVKSQLETDARENTDVFFSMAQGSFEWRKARALRLTATSFFKVCRRKKDFRKLVFDLLYSKGKSEAMKHGNDTEPYARAHFESKHGVSVRTCGLVLDKSRNFLAASPDGLIGDATLVEIKCPTSGADFPSAEEAVRAGKLPYLKFNSDGTLYLATNTDYFYQIQGQLHVCQRNTCILYVYQAKWEDKKNKTSPPTLIWDWECKVERDDVFWQEVEPKLVEFYETCLLPEIASSRYKERKRFDDIRDLEPPHIVEERRRKKEEDDRLKMEREKRKQQQEERRKEKERKRSEESDRRAKRQVVTVSEGVNKKKRI